MGRDHVAPRVATSTDADRVAQLLHDFNEEFDTPTPEPAVLADRLRVLLDRDDTIALLAGSPAIGLALLTLRTNVWYDGPVASLDELYVVPDRRGQGTGTAILTTMSALLADRGVALVEINVDEGDVDAQRFYERHGYTSIEPDTGERAFYYFRELDPPC